MSKGNWGKYAAFGLAALLWGCETPNSYAQSHEHSGQSEANKSLSEISAALQSANEPDQTTKPCEAETDDRDSDLCAQWKAADAAKKSADASWWQIWISGGGLLIGAVTMVAAIAAARYAKKAANETKRSAIAAEKTLSNQQHVAHVDMRPWIELEFKDAIIQNIAGELRLTVLVIAKNRGRTQAQNLLVYHEVVLDCPVTQSDVDAFFKIHKDSTNSGFSVLPEGEYKEVILHAQPVGAATDIIPVVMACATYGVHDPSGASQHQTGYAISLHKLTFDGDPPAPILVSSLSAGPNALEIAMVHHNKVT